MHGSNLSDEPWRRQTPIHADKLAQFAVKTSAACLANEQHAYSARMTRLSAFTSAPSSRTVMRLWFVGVLHAVTLHTTSAAYANEMTWHLEYRREADTPSNCPDENDLRTALSTKIGARDPFSKDAPRKITIGVTRTTERIEARIQSRDEYGNIVFDSTAHAPSWRCDQLATRIVFVLRDIVDPLNPSTPTSSNTQSPSSLPPMNDRRANDARPPEPTTAPIAPQPTTPANRPRALVRHSKPQVALSMGLGASWWNTPNTALSATVGIALRWPRVSVGFEGRYDYAWTLPLDNQVMANQLAMALLTCGHHSFVPTRFYTRGCLFGDLTRMSFDSAQVRLKETVHFIPQLGARLGAGFSVSGRWALELQADGRVAIHRAAFAHNDQELWQLPRFHGAIRANVVGLFDVF
jgi:hypothetical protein